VRIRKLRIFTFFFVILVLIAVYGLALLRTYVFKPPPSSAANPAAVVCATCAAKWVLEQQKDGGHGEEA